MEGVGTVGGVPAVYVPKRWSSLWTGAGFASTSARYLPRRVWSGALEAGGHIHRVAAVAAAHEPYFGVVTPLVGSQDDVPLAPAQPWRLIGKAAGADDLQGQQIQWSAHGGNLAVPLGEPLVNCRLGSSGVELLRANHGQEITGLD